MHGNLAGSATVVVAQGVIDTYSQVSKGPWRGLLSRTGETGMTLHKAPSVPDVSLLAHVKTLSGRRIEEARRRERITQEEFARAVGVGVRWLREIEGGNPSSRLEDHLQCAHHLKLSTGHILLPLLFMGYDMTFPFQLTEAIAAFHARVHTLELVENDQHRN
jgi:transcriptional regulator with XRE-family HTH domain